MSEPHPSEGIRYVSKSGSDAEDGLSWGSAYLTINKALSVFNERGLQGTIYLGTGIWEESLSLTRFGTRIIGLLGLEGGSIIKSPSNTTDTVHITGQWCELNNVEVRGHSSGHTAAVVRLGGRGGETASHTSLNRVVIKGADPTEGAWPNITTAGSGLVVNNAEYGAITESRVEACKRAVFYPSKAESETELGGAVSDAGSGQTFLDLACDSNTQDLVMKGGGACLFLRGKFVSGTTAGNSIELVETSPEAATQNKFIDCDWEEGVVGQKALIGSYMNVFVGCNISSSLTYEVTGKWNLLQSVKVTERLNVPGEGNILLGCIGNIIKVTGKRNLITRCLAHFTIEGSENVFDNPFGYDVTGTGIAEGFYGKAPIAKPKPGAGEAELRTALRNLGLIE